MIEYRGGQPSFKLVPQNPATFVGPYSGQPVKVAGDAGIHLFIYGMDIPATFPHGMNLKPAYDELKQVVVMAVFEGQADIAIGLDRLECPTVSLFSAPAVWYRLSGELSRFHATAQPRCASRSAVSSDWAYE